MEPDHDVNIPNDGRHFELSMRPENDTVESIQRIARRQATDMGEDLDSVCFFRSIPSDIPGTVYRRKATLHKHVNHCPVKLEITYVPGTIAARYRYWWELVDILYRTLSSEQTLELVMDSKQARGDGTPRFYFEKLKQSPDHDMRYIHAVECKTIVDPSLEDDPNAQWISVSKEKKFPVNTRRVRLTLRLPTDSPSAFDLKVDVRDAEGGTIGCDPQVGNDPPQPDI
jgi:hypothetical protein